MAMNRRRRAVQNPGQAGWAGRRLMGDHGLRCGLGWGRPLEGGWEEIRTEQQQPVGLRHRNTDRAKATVPRPECTHQLVATGRTDCLSWLGELEWS